MARLFFTRKATDDLRGIWTYTLKTWSESKADEYYYMLISACKNLLNDSFTVARSYSELGEEIYGYKVGKHLIFYRQDCANGDVVVIRILHERMDIRKRLLNN